MSDHLFAFARILPKLEHIDDARRAIQSIMLETRAEAGCHRFELYEGDNDGCLYLYEEWADEAALQEHHAKAYTRHVFAQYEAWLSEPVQITRLRFVV